MLLSASIGFLTVASHIQISKYNATKVKEIEAEKRKNALIDSFAVENIKAFIEQETVTETIGEGPGSFTFSYDDLSDKELDRICKNIVKKAIRFAQIITQEK